VPLPCIEGHDAFLVDLRTFGNQIGPFLNAT
jgi:homoserine acetyltransferase